MSDGYEWMITRLLTSMDHRMPLSGRPIVRLTVAAGFPDFVVLHVLITIG